MHRQADAVKLHLNPTGRQVADFERGFRGAVPSCSRTQSLRADGEIKHERRPGGMLNYRCRQTTVVRIAVRALRKMLLNQPSLFNTADANRRLPAIFGHPRPLKGAELLEFFSAFRRLLRIVRLPSEFSDRNRIQNVALMLRLQSADGLHLMAVD